MAETIQEKTYRLGLELLAVEGEEVVSLESVNDDPDFKRYCKFVAIAQAEALEEASKLHSFGAGAGMIDKSDLLDMAIDLRESVQ
jgi:hypothetical protein